MSEIPSELKYTKTHEWVRIDDDGLVTVGLTDHAQDLLGELVYVELPEIEADVSGGDDCGVVESVKAASDVYSPISGEIVEINTQLASAPELVNQDPYGAGWLFRIRPNDEGEIDEMLDADTYADHIESEEEEE
jgi:glycine cleavage system H protein